VGEIRKGAVGVVNLPLFSLMSAGFVPYPDETVRTSVRNQKQFEFRVAVPSSPPHYPLTLLDLRLF
jgi:hypothetical protein